MVFSKNQIMDCSRLQGGPPGTWPPTSVWINDFSPGRPIYLLHISINNHSRMQLVPWNGCESHMTDQLSRGGAATGVIHSLPPPLSLIPRRLSSLKAGNMHLSHVPHYSGCLSHLGQLTTNQEQKDKVSLSAGNPQRTEKATSSPNFSDSNFLKMWIFFWGSASALG